MSLLTEEQQERYTVFRRANIKDPVRNLMKAVTGTRPDTQNKVLLALSSVTKSFIGELVEEAKRAATAEGDTGALKPEHVIEAYHRLQEMGLVESMETPKPKLRL